MSKTPPYRRKFVAGLGALFGSTYLSACGGGGGDAAAAPAPAAPAPSPGVEPPAPAPTSPDGLPAWVPGPGRIANINLNNLSQFNPCAATVCWYSGYSKQEAAWRNWTGGALAKEYSTHGALVYWGGGHGGGSDHSLYLFDFATRLWSRVGPDLPTESYMDSLDKTWGDFLHQGSYIVPGLHTYNYPTYVPAGKSGAGSRGSWLLPCLVSSGGNSPHAVDLATGQWSRFTSAAAAGYPSPYSGVIEDTKRSRVWWGGVGTDTYRMLDFNEPHPRTMKTAPGRWFGGWYDRFVYVPEADMAVGFWCDFNQTLLKTIVLDMRTGSPVVVRHNPPPTKSMIGAGFGVDWCPLTQKFYLYEGRGRNVVTVLAPSSLDFANCNWTWSDETFSGAAAAWYSASSSGGGDIPLSRWRYVPALRSFGWSDGPRFSAVCEDGVTRDGIMQVWRPLGT